MEQLILKYLNFFGALALVYFTVRMGGYCLGRLLAGGWREDDGSGLLRGKSGRDIFFWGFFNSQLERDPRNTTYAILEFANSRMLSLRGSLTALRGAVVGDSYLLWIAAAFLWFVPSLSNSFGIAAMLSSAALVVYCFRGASKWLFFGVMSISLLMIAVSMTNFALSEIAIIENMRKGGVLMSIWQYTASGVSYSFIVGALVGLLLGRISSSSSFVAILALILSYSGFGASFSLGMAAAAPLGVLFSVVGLASKANSTAQRAFALHALTMFGVVVIAGFLNWSLYNSVIDRLIPFVAVLLGYWVVSIILPSVVWQIVSPFSIIICRLIPQRTSRARRLEPLSNTPSLYCGFTLSLLEAERDKAFARSHKIFTFTQGLLHLQKACDIESTKGRIHKYLELSQNAKNEMLDYILQLDTRLWSKGAKDRVIDVHSKILELEAFNERTQLMSELLCKVNNSAIPFSQSQKKILSELFDEINSLFKIYCLPSNSTRELEQKQTPEQNKARVDLALDKIEQNEKLYYIYHNPETLKLLNLSGEALKLIVKLKNKGTDSPVVDN